MRVLAPARQARRSLRRSTVWPARARTARPARWQMRRARTSRARSRDGHASDSIRLLTAAVADPRRADRPARSRYARPAAELCCRAPRLTRASCRGEAAQPTPPGPPAPPPRRPEPLPCTSCAVCRAHSQRQLLA